MIFWFSGTGNSYAVAKRIADALGEPLVSVAARMAALSAGTWDGMLELSPGERVGFVFPIYAWAPPRMVLEMVARLRVIGDKTGAPPHVFAVSTCGDEEGNATAVLRNTLARAGLKLDCAFTLRAPNNYILGFDVDPKEVEQEKRLQMEHRLEQILPVLRERKTGVFELLPGGMAGLKTTCINPMFNRFAMNPARFRSTEACTACGICAQVCPAGNIQVGARPEWGKRCTQCLACIHQCPRRAIEYGKATEKKGRYVHPEAKGMRPV